MCKYILLVCVTVSYCQTDPCTNHIQLENVKRSTAKVLISGDIAISDDRLTEGWYRVVSLSGEDMPTEPPGVMGCGTLYPIWLNGTLPISEGTQVSRQVCIETFMSQCEVSWNINIRRCPGGFLVYYLVQSTHTSSAYCFGTEVPCPDGEYSETGFTPGCSADVPPETFTPIVIADLVTGTIFNPSLGPSLEPVFNCSFREVTGQSYTYDIKWLINGDSIIVRKRLAYSNLDQALLRPADWVNTYHLNMVVKCEIKARLNSTSVPGPMFESPLFEAGVKPESTVHSVFEGEEISIQFTSSIPVGCVGSNDNIRPHCTRTLKIAQPKYQSTPTETCTSNIEAESLAFDTQDCGLTMSVDNWRDKLYLNVTGYIDNVYNTKDRVGHIRLTTDLNSSTDLSGVWHKVIIPDVQVYVSDKDSSLTKRLCKAWNDPQFRTADGKSFGYHGAGEFVFYRHKRYPYWVHILTSACSWNSGLTCVCGVAVRSHDSLFVVRSCDVISTEIYVSGRHYPSITYSVCDNKHMIIEKLSNNQYKVTLPIGTEILYSTSRRWNPVIVLKPSLLDIEQSEGLCGYISKERDTSDDFIPRDSNTTISSATDFAKSWRVISSSDEELFSPLPKLPKEDPFLKEYCLCAAEASQTTDIAQLIDVHCNLTAPMVQCKNTRTPVAQSLYNVCHKEKQTRDVKDSDDVIEDIPLSYDPNYNPDYLPPEPVWRNGWNETIARQACINYIQEMPSLELCKVHAKIIEEDYMESCIEDIRTAGNSDVMQNTVILIQSECQLEISRNESLWGNSSENDGESIFDQIQNLLCPPNCSKNGYCYRTECVCNQGFLGPDCSISLSDGPTQLTVPDKGSCNTKLRSCSKTNIFGDFYSDDIYCKLRHFIITESGKELSGRVYTKQAVYSYENKISCTFPDNTRKRSTTDTLEGYEISLSYNQVNYGSSVSVIIYDGQCYTCNTSTFTCDRLDSCQDNLEDDDDDDSKSPDENATPVFKIAVAITLSVLFVIIAVALVVFKCNSNKHRKRCGESTLVDFNGSSSLQIGAPPKATNLPPYRNENSNLAFEWPSRESSVADLFVADSFTH